MYPSNEHRSQVIIACLSLDGIGATTVRRLLASDTNLRSAEDVIARLETSRPPRSRPVSPATFLSAMAKAEGILEECGANAIATLTVDEADYPPLLFQDSAAPPLLYVKGSRSAIRGGIAIVGTRRPTARSHATAFRIGQRCGRAGIVAVSGMAVGCDQAVHEGCVAESGTTVAVLGGGILSAVADTGQGLAERIIASGGCLVSAYPPTANTEIHRLVERDRLIAAMSTGVFIIETALNGGSMHAARHAHRKLLRPVAVLGPYGEQQEWPSDNEIVAAELGAAVISSGDQFDGWRRHADSFSSTAEDSKSV